MYGPWGNFKMSHFTSIIGSITLDETSGLQNDYEIGDAFPGDEDDNDILYSQSLLPAAFWTWLQGLGVAPLDVALSNYDGIDATMDSTKMVDIDGSSLDPLRFSSDSNGTELPVYDPLLPPADPSVNGIASGIYDLDGNQIYLFQLKGDPNIVVGIDASGDYSLAIYLDQATSSDGTNLEARIWTVQFEALKHPVPGDPDEAISLDDVLYLTSVDNLTFDASHSPSGQNLFIMFGEGDGTYDFGIIATGKEPINQSSDPSAITSGDTVNTSQAGGPTTFGINNQMLTSSSTPGEGDGIVFTYVTNTNSAYTVPNLDQNEADVEANIDFTGVFTADSATFDIVQLQGGKTAVVKITAINSSNIDPREDYIDGQLADIGGLGSTTDIVDVTNITVTGTRGTNNNKQNVTFDIDYSALIVGVRTQVTDGAYSIYVTYNADGTVIIDGVKAGDNIEFTTDGDHNRVLIENWGDGSGQDSANFDIGGFQLLDIAAETLEIGDKIFWEDDGPGLGSTAPELVEEEQIDNANSVGNEDYNNVPLLDTDTAGNLNVVTQQSTLDYNAVVAAGTDQQAKFWLDVSGLPEDGVAYDSVSGLLKTGLTAASSIADGLYSIDDGTTTYTFNASGNTLQQLVDDINTNAGTVATAELIGDRLVLTSTDSDTLTLAGFEGVIYETAPTLYSKGAVVNFDFATSGTGTVPDPYVYTLTGTVVSITGATTLELTDTIPDATYTITNTVPADDFTFIASGNTLQELIDQINLSSVATATLVGGELVIESLNGDDLALTSFDNIAPSLVDGTYDDTRDVLTWSVTEHGMASFEVLDQLDHAAGGGENILLVNLQGYLHVVDGDDDPVELGDLGKYNVIDDVPIESGNTVSGTVEEEHALAGGNEDTTGGVAPAIDADTLVGPDYDMTKNTVTGNLQSLVLVGTDEVVGGGAAFSLADMTQGELDAFVDALELYSQGEKVTTAVISNGGKTLTAQTSVADGSDDIFSLTIEENGDYSFTLIRTLDHDPTANGGDNTENLEIIDLTGLIMATDFDGDELVLDTSGEDSSSFLIKVIDDIPKETGSFVTGTVEEEHSLAGGNEDTAGGTVGTVVIDSDLDNDNAALNGAYVLAAGVYTLATISGTTTFTAPGDGTDLQALIDEINNDGWANAEIIGGDLIITSSEAVTLTGFSGIGDLVDGVAYVEGIDEDTSSSGAGADVTTGSVSGNLQSLVSIGADQVASDGGATFDFAFADDAALDAFIVTLGLSSQGEAVTQADISGNTLTAKTADGDAIFSLTVADNGDYTFTLLRNLDHPDPGSGATEDVLTIDLSGLIKAEDFDGDEIVLGSGGGASSFLIYAIDDVPLLEVGNILGVGTNDPQIGEWANLSGADGFKSLAIELDSFTYGPSSTLVQVDSDLGTPTVGPNGELIFADVAITADFDANPLTGDAQGKETLTFDLTFNTDGTYVFNLDELFVSSVTFSTSDGQLPAGGPDPVQTLAVGDEDIVFFALSPLALATDVITSGALDKTESQLESSPPSFISSSYLMNVSTSGIGVGNNVLQGDTNAARTAGDESFIVNPDTPLTSVKVYIDNSVGGYDEGPEKLYYTVYFEDGTSSGPILVLDGDLSPEAGGQTSFIIDWSDFGETSMIEAVQLTMTKGMIKIPVIEFFQETAVALDPITINFAATLTDGDNDAVTDQFSVIVETDDNPLSGPDIVFDGTGDADAFNIDLASGFTSWVINGFDSTDGSLIDGDVVVLLNPLFDYGLVTSNVGDDVITINGTTITIKNGAAELSADDILVAYSDTIIDGDILVGTVAGQDLTGAADADALIVKADLDEVTGGAGGDAFVFINPANSVNSITDFDSSEGDFLVISASGFGVDIDEGALTGTGNFVAGAAALDADDYFVFNAATGNLSFDADGNGAGAAVLIANFGTATLTADDIFIIA